MSARIKIDSFVKEYRDRFPYPPEISPTLRVIKMFADWIDSEENKELADLRTRIAELEKAMVEANEVICEYVIQEGASFGAEAWLKEYRKEKI